MSRSIEQRSARLMMLVLSIALAGCSSSDATGTDGPVSGTVEISSITCTYTHTDGFLNRYYIIKYGGTATGSEGMQLQFSSPDFGSGTKYTSNCGGWTSFTWGGGFPGCERKAGQPETITWSASSDLWIGNQTHRQEASLWHPQTGSLGKLIKSIRCLS